MLCFCFHLIEGKMSVAMEMCFHAEPVVTLASLCDLPAVVTASLRTRFFFP